MRFSNTKREIDILDAAIEIITEKGYQYTTIQETADLAGLSKPGLYRHFPSKDVLFLEACRKIFEVPYSSFLDESVQMASAAQGLMNYIKSHVSFCTKNKKWFKCFMLLMINEFESEYVREQLMIFFERYINLFAGLYQKGIDNKEFRPHDTRASTLNLLSAMDGMLSCNANHQLVDEAQIIDELCHRNVHYYKIK